MIDLTQEERQTIMRLIRQHGLRVVRDRLDRLDVDRAAEDAREAIRAEFEAEAIEAGSPPEKILRANAVDRVIDRLASDPHIRGLEQIQAANTGQPVARAAAVGIPRSAI